jgi:hypothetical protein
MKKDNIIYWISTILAMLTGATTAFFYFNHPFFVTAFQHLGFPAYFRIELAVAKILGMVALLWPAAPRLIKEWSYIGFAITFISGSIAHGLIDGWGKGAAPLFSLAALVLSYYYFRKLNAFPVSSK